MFMKTSMCVRIRVVVDGVEVAPMRWHRGYASFCSGAELTIGLTMYKGGVGGRARRHRCSATSRQGRHDYRRRSQRGRRAERVVVVVIGAGGSDLLISASSSALVGVMRDGDDGVFRSGASCPIRVGLLISCSQRSSLARSTARCQWPDLRNLSLADIDSCFYAPRVWW